MAGNDAKDSSTPAPIALFSETLRVQSALWTFSLASLYTAPALTGCINDFRQLWSVNEFSLFCDFGTGRSVVNSHHLVNKAVLGSAGITGHATSREAPIKVKPSTAIRPTTVSITFVTPRPMIGTIGARESNYYKHVFHALTTRKISSPCAIPVVMELQTIFVGAVLQTCVAANAIVLFVLDVATRPRFEHTEPSRNDM